MSAESWLLDEIGVALDRARDSGEPALPLGELRERTGAGHEDLMEALSEMRERGELVEGAPGEWRRPFDDERPETEPAAEAPLHVHESSEETLAEAEARAAGREPAAPRERTVGEPGDARSEVRLTMAVAAALDEATIGQLVKAGIAEAGEQARAFVLRVEP